MTALRPFPIPANDRSRVAALDTMRLLERRQDPFFSEITALAKEIFAAPVGFLSLMGTEHQCLLHCDGADVDETPRSLSLCAFTVAARKTVILHDTHLDPRSVNHPIVTGAFKLRFSASAPIILSSGFCIGTICAVDFEPHGPPDAAQVRALERLAVLTARFYEAPGEPDHARAAEMRRIVEDAQEEFLSLISHELRTPLNGIHGLASLLEPSDEDEASLVDGILGSAELLNNIVQNILSFTELASGDIALNEGPVDLAQLVRHVLATNDAIVKLRGKTCDLSAVPAALPVTGDHAKLELALSCIAMNFIAHGGANGTVSMGHRTDGAVEMTFSDDGAGISSEREAKIFEAFGVGKSVTQREADGIGLGLPLSRRIVELHGGELDLVQTHPGVRVVIRLPTWRADGAGKAVS